MNECIPVEEMGTLGQLPDDDPRRRHVAICPRCSALAFAHEEFVLARNVEGADPRGAETRLAQFIAARVEAAPDEPARVAGAPRPGRGRWFGASMWPTAAVAATVVLAAVALVRWQPWVANEIVYRGEPGTQLAGLVATAGPDGVIEMRWDEVKGADAYRVAILTEDLVEVTRLAPVSGLSQRFDPRAGADPAPPWYWQVTALLEGAELLSSDPQRLP